LTPAARQIHWPADTDSASDAIIDTPLNRCHYGIVYCMININIIIELRRIRFHFLQAALDTLQPDDRDFFG